MDNSAYLTATGKTPHWAEVPCGVCERERLLAEIKEKPTGFSQYILDDLLDNSMRKRRFADKTFDNFLLYGNHQDRQEKVLSYVREFADNFAWHRKQGTWLLFVGNSGAGKGHLCAAIINHITKSGYSALITKTPRLLREMKETYKKDAARSQSEILNMLGCIDLLIIDEIGVQFGTDAERMIFYEVLDNRYEAMQPVILTSNIRNMKTITKLLGERIIDRFFEGDSKIVFFDWESHRRLPQFEMEAAAPSKHLLGNAPGADSRHAENSESSRWRHQPFGETALTRDHRAAHRDGDYK